MDEVKLADVLKENKARDERERWTNGELPNFTPREIFSFFRHADDDDQETFVVMILFFAIGIASVAALVFALGYLIGSIASVIALIVNALL